MQIGGTGAVDGAAVVVVELPGAVVVSVVVVVVVVVLDAVEEVVDAVPEYLQATLYDLLQDSSRQAPGLLSFMVGAFMAKHGCKPVRCNETLEKHVHCDIRQPL